jgi:hypothetical protein
VLIRAAVTASSGDVEQDPTAAQTLLMTLLAMLEARAGTSIRSTEGADADRGEEGPKGVPHKKFRYESPLRVPRRDAGFVGAGIAARWNDK